MERGRACILNVWVAALKSLKLVFKIRIWMVVFVVGALREAGGCRGGGAARRRRYGGLHLHLHLHLRACCCLSPPPLYLYLYLALVSGRDLETTPG